MADIKNTLEVLELARQAGVTTAEVLADGKVGLTDLPKLAKLWSPAKAALEGVSVIQEEVKDLDAAEVTQLINSAVAVATAWMAVFSVAQKTAA